MLTKEDAESRRLNFIDLLEGHLTMQPVEMVKVQREVIEALIHLIKNLKQQPEQPRRYVVSTEVIELTKFVDPHNILIIKTCNDGTVFSNTFSREQLELQKSDEWKKLPPIPQDDDNAS